MYETKEEASSVVDAAIEELRSKRVELAGGKTLRSYAAQWFDAREREGVTTGSNDRNRWTNHVDTAPFADWPMQRIAPQDIVTLVTKLREKRVSDLRRGPRRLPRKLSLQTVKHALCLLRCCLASAVDDGLIGSNPAQGIGPSAGRTARRAKCAATTTKLSAWTYLDEKDQRKLANCATIPELGRLLIAFAIGTGLRQGELWTLHLADVHAEDDDPHILVRWGSRSGGKLMPPKSGEARTVPLVGPALNAARRLLELLPTIRPKNPHRLLFPTLRGGYQRRAKPPRGWYA